jgi:hypothetical protein
MRITLKHAVYGKGQEVVLLLTRYGNGNRSLELHTLEGEPFMRASVNPGRLLADNHIAIKDWSENEGIVQDLIDAKVISPHAIDVFTSGFVSAFIYPLLRKDI